jgi:hypothetical protein
MAINNNNNNTCYLVTHQSYIYACGCGFCSGGGGGGEYKDVLENNFDILGVFSTEKLAKKFIKKHSEDRCDGDKPYAKAQREWHYDIYKIQIDNPLN